jgi:hypothetical protein
MPAALSTLYTTQTLIEDVLSSEGVDLRVDDDGDGNVTDEEIARLTTDAVNYATARCNLYLCKRYSTTQLGTDWNVQRWATDIAAVWMCQRRGNPCPESLLKRLGDSMDEMVAVQNGSMDLAEAAERVADLPYFSNGTLDNRYRLRQWRIERPLSDQTPGGLQQATSLVADILGPIEQGP